MNQGKKEVIYFSILSMVSKVSTYILLLIFANFFAEAEFGRAKFILSIFYLFSSLVLLGLPNSLVPFYVNYRKKLSTVFYFYSVLVLIFVIAGGLAFFKDIFLVILALSGAGFFLIMFFIGVFQSQHKHHLHQLFRTLIQIVPIFLIFPLMKLGSNGIIMSFAITFLILGGVILIFNRKELPDLLKLDLDLCFLKKYFKFSLIAMLILYAFMIIGWVDSSILGWLSTYENVALYNIAGPMSNIITIIPLALSMFLLTRISSVHKDKGLSFSILKRVMRISLFLSIIGAVLLSCFAFLITRIFMPVYHGKVEVFFVILLMGVMMYSLYHLVYFYYAGRFEIQKVLFPILVATAVNIILDIIWIPKFGLYGICFATLIAHLVAFTLLIWKVGLFRIFWPMYFIVLLIPASFFLEYYGVLILAVLIPLMYFSNLIQKGDIEVVVDTVKGVFSR